MIAVLVFVLVGLSLMVSATAFKAATLSNGSQIVISTTEQAGLKVAAGLNNPGGIVTTVNGKLMLNVALDANSTYGLNNIIRVTNDSGAQKTVSVSVTGKPAETTLTITGAPSWIVPDQQYVDVSLAWTTGADASGSMNIVVDAQ